MSDTLRLLLLSPGSLVGFAIGLAVPIIFRWRPSAILFLPACLLSLPTCIILLSGPDAGKMGDGSGSSAATISMFLVYFWGTAGSGAALMIWLLVSTIWA